MQKRTLPQRPSLDQLRRQAKDLLKQLRNHDPSALDQLRKSHPEFEQSTDGKLQQTAFALNHAQLVIAREYGFPSWTRLKRQIELLQLDDRDRIETFVTSALVDHHDPRAANFERARAILDADPNIVHATFHSALVTGEVEEIETHIKRDSELAARKGGPNDWEPLLYVCFSRFLQRDESRSKNFAEIVRQLLDHGADPNACFMVNEDPNARQTCLYGAAGIANNASITKLLLDAGADPNDGAPGLGPESLYHAAEHKDVECLRLILASKPDPDKVSYCLGRCLDFENPAGIKLFLEAGADPNFVRPGGGDGSTRLHGAIRNGRSGDVIRLLLEAGADGSREDYHRMTPYRLAVRTGHYEAVELMEARGADVKLASVVDRFIGECLRADHASLQANYEGAKKILDENPGLFQRMRPDDLAMISVASYLRRPNAVKAMLLLGFPINIHGPERMSALHWACWVGDTELAEFLVERAADLELRNGYGGTALGCAVYAAIQHGGDTDYAPLVRLLLENGAVVKDNCAYPTGIASIDSLLKAYVEKKPPTRGQNHVQLLADHNKLASRQMPADASVKQVIEIWARSLIEGHAIKAQWTAVLLSNWSPTVTGQSPGEIFRGELSESNAFDSAARYFGYQSWRQVDSEPTHKVDLVFESAVDAVVGGETEQLSQQLKKQPELATQRSAFGHHCTLLHYVAANGVEIHRQTVPPNAVEIARLLLETGAEPDALADTYGGGSNQTTLSLLITSGHPYDAGLVEPLIQLLVEYGANVNGVENNGQPLKVTLDFGYTRTAETLVRLGAKVFTISQAAGVGRVAELLRLLKHRPNQKELDEALYLAARNGQMNCLKPLLDAGANLNTRGWFGGPALHWAAINGHESTVKFLLNQGADPNLRDDRFRAHAAGWANENGHDVIRDWLLNNGCKASIVEAAAFGRIDLVKKSLESDPRSVNTNEDRTPLHEAAGRGNLELLRLLLAHGADRSAKDENDLNPVDWARREGHEQVIAILESGVDP